MLVSSKETYMLTKLLGRCNGAGNVQEGKKIEQKSNACTPSFAAGHSGASILQAILGLAVAP